MRGKLLNKVSNDQNFATFSIQRNFNTTEAISRSVKYARKEKSQF